jgi:hypothetical protein
MKNKIFLISSVCIAVLVCAQLAVSAADKEKKASSPATTSSASPAAKSARPVPFRGTISAVDQTAKTFTIAGKEKSRVFKVTDKTAVTKAGQPATMTDIVENAEVSGSYWKAADGSLEAKTVKVGPMAAKKAADEGKKSKASASPAASPKASPKPY